MTYKSMLKPNSNLCKRVILLGLCNTSYVDSGDKYVNNFKSCKN